MKIFILTCVFCISGLLVFGQSLPKRHYTIINPSFDFTLNYEKALSHTQLDGLRFFDQRRKIPVEGTQIVIELYSAKELQKLYGKQISPLTIMDHSKGGQIKFKMAANNYKLEVISNQ